MAFKQIYDDLIKEAEYDYQNIYIKDDNNQYLAARSIADFCARQVEKFENPNEDKHGCCLNFSLYLLAKKDGIFMTTKDKPMVEGGRPTLHCAFVYEEDGELFVADPATDKNRGTKNDCYKIPLRSYNFPMEDQVYTLYLGIKRDSQNSFFKELQQGAKLNFQTFEDLTDDQQAEWVEIIRNNRNFGAVDPSDFGR